MTDIITKIFEMSLLGSIVIAITLFARLLLNKKSKSLIMILWIAVALRLLCPISIESSFSLFNVLPQRNDVVAEPKSEEIIINEIKPNYVSNEEISNLVTNDINTHINNEVNISTNNEIIMPSVISEEEVIAPKTSISLTGVLGIVWGVGVCALLIYTVISYVSLNRKLKDAEEVEQNVYESDKIPSPFVFGIVKPKIYIPIGLGETEKELILTHERIHIRKGDYLSKILGMICVCIHWFNPIVWFAFMLFEQDTEMRCDEEVLRELGSNIKEKYSLSLVSFATRNRDMRYAVLPVSFSKAKFNKNEVTVRVKNLITYRGGSRLVATIIAVALIAVSTSCILNAKADTVNPADEEIEADVSETEETEEVVLETEETIVEDIKTTIEEVEEVIETNEVVVEETVEETTEEITEETTEEATEETTEEAAIEPKTEQIAFDDLIAIREDIEAIKAYHANHPNEEIYIGWEIWPGSEHVTFLIYRPDASSAVDWVSVEPFAATVHARTNVNAELVYGDYESGNFVMAANDFCFDTAVVSNYLANYYTRFDYFPSYSYDRFVGLSAESILASTTSMNMINIPVLSTLPDGIYAGKINSFDEDFASANFTVGKLIGIHSMSDLPVTCDEVNVTLPISNPCAFYDNGLGTAGGRSVPTTFEESILYMSLNDDSYGGEYGTYLDYYAFIKVENGQVVAIDMNYWL